MRDENEITYHPGQTGPPLSRWDLGLIAGPVQIDPGTWAIHGSIPGEGEVILAEFHPPEPPSNAIGIVQKAEEHLLITDGNSGSHEPGHLPFP